MNKDGSLVGMVTTCVDDFSLAGKASFVDKITEKVSAVLDVSKVEDNKFRYTKIYIHKVEDGIEISMDDYAESLQEITLREDRSEEKLS